MYTYLFALIAAVDTIVHILCDKHQICMYFVPSLMGRSQIIRRREILFFYKSFNALWLIPSISQAPF